MLFNDVVGHYRNRNQAFSNPSTWPQIDIRIIEPSYGILLAKSWYKYKGEEEPYNYIQYDWQRMDENIVYTKTTNLITNTPSCPFIWNWDGTWWNGNTALTAGNLIKIRIPSSKEEGDNVELDRRFSGKYIIAGLTHIYKKTGLTTKLYLVRDSIPKP